MNKKVDFDIEKEAVRICLALKNNEGANANEKSFTALKWLESDGLIKDMKLTEKGELYLQAVTKDPTFDTLSISTQFKNEALTGLTTQYNKKSGCIVSKRSLLKRAVLPNTNKSASKSSNNAEDKMLEQCRQDDIKKQIAQRLGITVELCSKHLAENRVKMCTKCQSLGIFDKHGDRLQHLCRECRKRKRQKEKELKSCLESI